MEQYRDFSFTPIIAPYGGDISLNVANAAGQLAEQYDKNEALHLKLEAEYGLTKTIDGDDAGKQAVRKEIDDLIGAESSKAIKGEGKIGYHRIGDKIKRAVLAASVNPDFLAEQESYANYQKEQAIFQEARAKGEEVLNFTDAAGHKTVNLNPDGTKTYNVYNSDKQVKQDWTGGAKKLIGEIAIDGNSVDLNSIMTELDDVTLGKDVIANKRYQQSWQGRGAKKVNTLATSHLDNFIDNTSEGKQMYRAYTELPEYKEGNTTEEVEKNARIRIAEMLKLSVANQIGIVSQTVSAVSIKQLKDDTKRKAKEAAEAAAKPINPAVPISQKIVAEPLTTGQAKERLKVLKESTPLRGIISMLNTTAGDPKQMGQELGVAYNQYLNGNIKELENFYNKNEANIKVPSFDKFYEGVQAMEVDALNNEAILEKFEQWKNNPTTKKQTIGGYTGALKGLAGLEPMNPFGSAHKIIKGATSTRDKSEDELFKGFLNENQETFIEYKEQIDIPYFDKKQNAELNDKMDTFINTNTDFRGYIKKNGVIDNQAVSSAVNGIVFNKDNNGKTVGGKWIMNNPLIVGEDNKPVYGRVYTGKDEGGKDIEFIIPMSEIQGLPVNMKRVNTIMDAQAKIRGARSTASITDVAYVQGYGKQVFTVKVAANESDKESKQSEYRDFFVSSDNEQIIIQDGLTPIRDPKSGVVSLFNLTDFDIKIIGWDSQGNELDKTIEPSGGIQ